MSRLSFDFGPDGPPAFVPLRPWREVVTALHGPAERAFRAVGEKAVFREGVLWLLDRDRASLRAAALCRDGEVRDGEEEMALEQAPRLRRALEAARRTPFPLADSLWAPLVLFGASLGVLELRAPGDGAAGPRLEEAARALALSVWRASQDVRDHRRELHLRTLSEAGILVHQSLKPERLLEDAARRLARNLGLDRIKIYLWDSRRRSFRGEVSFTPLDGTRGISHEAFDPGPWKGDDGAARVRHAVPLSAAGETVGWLAVDNLLSQQEIPMDEVHLLEAVAGQLALAVRNAELYRGVETLATTDELTKLLLGRVFHERLEAECRRAERLKTPFAVCMMDVDKFKSINDGHGHPVGDKVLAGVAKKLKSVSRRMDVVARYAGDEFIVLLPNAGAAHAMSFAKRVNEGVRRLSIPGAGGAVVGPTVSIGVSVFPEHGARPEELVRAADEALYRTKRAGRDGATLYAPEDSA